MRPVLMQQLIEYGNGSVLPDNDGNDGHPRFHSFHSGLSFQNNDTSPLPFGRGDDKCTQLSFLNFRFGASSPAERYRGGVAGQKYFPETRATYHIQLCLSSRTRKLPVYLHLTE